MIKNKKLLIINKGALPDEYVTFLNKKGINATLLQFSPQKKYIYNNSKITDKLMNVFHRLFLKNNNYIYTLENKSYSKEYCIQIKEFFKKETFFDYVLILRPDNFDSSFLKIVKNHSEKVNGYDVNMIYGLEDYEFWISLLKNEKKNTVKKLPQTLFYYRVKENSMLTNLKSERINKMFNYISKKHTDFFLEYLGSFNELFLLQDNALKNMINF